MIIFQIISTLVFAQDLSDADFPYCFDEFHGTLTQTEIQREQVNYGKPFRASSLCGGKKKRAHDDFFLW